MKNKQPIGIKRKVGDLGRVSIPIELRKALGIVDNETYVEITAYTDDTIEFRVVK